MALEGSGLRSPDTDPSDISILINAPFRSDGAYLNEFFLSEGVGSVTELDINNFPTPDEPVVLVCTQEGLSVEFLSAVRQHLRDQPQWSQLPILLILDPSFSSGTMLSGLRAELASAMVVILERPLKSFEVSSATKGLIAARHKQLQIRDHIDVQIELQRELNHRLKNTFATFMAIYRMTARQSDSLDAFKTKFDGRANALLNVQDLLRETDPDKRTIRGLFCNVLSPYVDEQSSRLEFKGESVPIAGDVAFTLSLVFNELATNALKYGSLSNADGIILLMCLRSGNDRILLEWRESGGPTVTPPERTSYGTCFIEASAANLGGDADFDYKPTGFVCRLSIRQLETD